MNNRSVHLGTLMARTSQKFAMVLVLGLLVLVFSLLSPHFFTVSNLTSIFVQNAYVVVVAIGVGFLMISGGMDMSIGFQISLVAVTTSMLMKTYGVPVPLAVIAGLAGAVGLGLVNCFASIKLKVHPLVVTLATMTVFQGISYILSNSQSFYNFDDSFKFIGQGSVFGIPVCVLVMVLMAGLASFILNKTYIGRHIYALGSNAEATRLSGVNINRLKVVIFALVGLFTGVATILLASRAGSVSSATGPGTEFTCMTAAILGGISFMGGEGKVWGVVVGVMILGVLTTGMQIIGLGSYPQYIAKGLVLAAAIAFDIHSKQKPKRVRSA